MSNDLMTVNEVAARWKLGHLAVRRRILDGKLNAVKLGRFVRIPLASVQEYERTEFLPMVATPQTPPELGNHPQTTPDPTPATIRERARAVADRTAQLLADGMDWKTILLTLEAEGCRTSHGGLYTKQNLESLLHSRARRMAGDGAV